MPWEPGQRRRQRYLARWRRRSETGGERARIGRLGLGDLPTWIALIGVPAAIIFGGVQACQSAKQSEQTERALKQNERALDSSQQALNASTAVSIYQEEREVQKLVTPKLWPYFKQGQSLPVNDSDLARKAYVVAGAFLDHFEHLRVQADSGAINANRDAWGEYITWSFSHSPLLCSELRYNLRSYGGKGPYTIWGQWGEAVCGRTTPAAGWKRCGKVPARSKRDRAIAPSYFARYVLCPEARSIISDYAALPRQRRESVDVRDWRCAQEFGGRRVTCTPRNREEKRAIRWYSARGRRR